MSKNYSDTTMGGEENGFPTTKWTQISDPKKQEAILEELYQRYWKPVYHSLRCKGFSNDKAKDLVQGFFTDKVLGREFIQRVDKSKGRFRTFLLTAVKNYVIDLQRKEKPTSPYDSNIHIVPETSDQVQEFNKAWAEEILETALNELKTECKQSSNDWHWKLFKIWFLDSQEQIEKKRMKYICEKLEIPDVQQAYYTITRMKDRFRVILRRSLRPMVESDSEIDREIREFIEIFS